MELIRELREIVDLVIPTSPISNGHSHETEIVKPAKQADHAGDILRIDLAPCKPLIYYRHIWSGFFKLDAGKFISQGRPVAIHVRLEVPLVTRAGVLHHAD